jgi:hypothetical protein
MCNHYSITTNQAAIIALFRVLNRYVGNLPPMPGVFPDYPAPVARNADTGRELTFESLVNDIAFSKCEEPLTSANFWRSLSTIDQLDLRLSLRSPEQRRGSSAPTIIKLAPSDLATKVTPEMLTRLSAQITV